MTNLNKLNNTNIMRKAFKIYDSSLIVLGRIILIPVLGAMIFLVIIGAFFKFLSKIGKIGYNFIDAYQDR